MYMPMHTSIYMLTHKLRHMLIHMSMHMSLHPYLSQGATACHPTSAVAAPRSYLLCVRVCVCACVCACVCSCSCNRHSDGAISVADTDCDIRLVNGLVELHLFADMCIDMRIGMGYRHVFGHVAGPAPPWAAPQMSQPAAECGVFFSHFRSFLTGTHRSLPTAPNTKPPNPPKQRRK